MSGYGKKGKNGKFSVKSLYDQLAGDEKTYSFPRISKAKIPYKIKIFLWLVENNANQNLFVACRE
jgi:hypothetical protein